MKKNRPAKQLSIIARKEQESLLAKIVLRDSSTFGLRVMPIYRYEAERQSEQVETRYGTLTVKVKILDGEKVYAAPEYDEVKALADAKDIPFLDVWLAAITAVEVNHQAHAMKP